jgi:hypothetical protein
MYPVIIFALALLASWWALNVVINLITTNKIVAEKGLDDPAQAKRLDSQASYSVVLDILAVVFWAWTFWPWCSGPGFITSPIKF